MDTFAHIDIADPIAALVLGAPPSLELLLVNGRPIVEGDQLTTLHESVVARDVALAHTALLAKAAAT